MKNGWYQYRKDQLQPLIDPAKRAILPNDERQTLSPEQLINEIARLAVEEWVKDHTERISNVNFNPRLAWQSVKILTAGEKAHHKAPNQAFKKPDWTLAQKILEPHFQKVFNNYRPVDFEIIDKIPDCPTSHNEAQCISFAEFEEALDSLANDKACSENGVSPQSHQSPERSKQRATLLLRLSVLGWRILL